VGALNDHEDTLLTLTKERKMKSVLKMSPLVWSVVLLFVLTPVAFDLSSGVLMLNTAHAQGGNGGGGNGGGGNGGGGNGGGGNGGGGNGGAGGSANGSCDGTGLGMQAETAPEMSATQTQSMAQTQTRTRTRVQAQTQLEPVAAPVQDQVQDPETHTDVTDEVSAAL